MICAKDVGRLSEGETNFLLNQTLDADKGYMRLYLDLCKRARLDYKKIDFVCDVVRFDNQIGNLNAWCIIQNLLYKYEDYLDLSVWVPKAKRGQGYGSQLLEYVANRYDVRKIALWANVDDSSIHLYRKFNKHPFYVFDSHEYMETRKYVKFDFDQLKK